MYSTVFKEAKASFFIWGASEGRFLSCLNAPLTQRNAEGFSSQCLFELLSKIRMNFKVFLKKNVFFLIFFVFFQISYYL